MYHGTNANAFTVITLPPIDLNIARFLQDLIPLIFSFVFIFLIPNLPIISLPSDEDIMRYNIRTVPSNYGEIRRLLSDYAKTKVEAVSAVGTIISLMLFSFSLVTVENLLFRIIGLALTVGVGVFFLILLWEKSGKGSSSRRLYIICECVSTVLIIILLAVKYALEFGVTPFS
jgi:hypothetical protein